MVTKYIDIEEFAGGGGATTGRRMATGRSVDVAVNHSLAAIAMHAMNHPETLHFCQDVWKVDPLDVLEMVAKLRGWGEAVRVAVASGWFSPDCTFFSKAKGGATLDARVRALCWILLKWCGRGARKGRVRVGKRDRRDRHGDHGTGPACPLILYMENVEEFKSNGPLVAKRDPKTGRVVKRDGSVAAPGEHVRYRDQWLVPCRKRAGLYFTRFIRWLRALGAAVEWRELRACDYGAPTIRKRLFLIIRFDGQPIVWPEPTHGDPASEAVKSGRRKPWREAWECLDFTLPCPSIFMTRRQARAYYKRTGIRIQRPLVKATCGRVAEGARRHVIEEADPFLIAIAHGEASPQTGKKRWGKGHRTVRAPMPTLTGSNEHALVTAHLVKLRGDNVGQAVTTPAHTLSAQGNHLGLIASFLAQQNGGEVGHQSYGHPLTEPVSTLSSKGAQQQLVALSLTKYYGADQDPRLREPMCTMTTRDRVAVTALPLEIPPLTPEKAKKARRVARFLRRHGVPIEGEFAMVGEFVVWDLGMRMLTPREQYRVQGFPEETIIDRGLKEVDGRMQVVPLTKTEQVQMCGNSVSPPVAAAIIAANQPRLDREEVAA